MPSSPQLVLAAALLVASAAAFFGFRAARVNRLNNKREAAWPVFVEALISTIAGGVSIAEGFELATTKAPKILSGALNEFTGALKTKRVIDALPCLSESFSSPQVDEFVKLVSINLSLGGVGLVALLQEHAKSCRERDAANQAARSKNSATLTVAKLGVAAPWVLLFLLLSRPETSAAFDTPQGVGVLLFGLLVCSGAFRLIVLLGRQDQERRVYLG